MKILCKSCIHNSVCKHKFNYEQTIETLDTKISTPFTLTLNCPFYKQEQYCSRTIVNVLDTSATEITATGTITNTANDELTVKY